MLPDNLHAPGHFPDWSASLAAMGTVPAGAIRDIHRAIRLAKRFNKEVVIPIALETDAAVQDDPEWLAHDFIRRAGEWKLFSRWIPRMFGGGGWHLLSLYAFLEEVSSECVALANVIGVHYLGVSTLSATWNLGLMQRIFSEVRESEKRGDPCLISLAITEPGAGTDVEETQLIDHAILGTHAVKQEDGSYRLNGRKVFISNGHVSRWHMVITYGDRKRAADTIMVLAVRTGFEGFSFGAKENKMGQKACVASELIFEDCKVPASCVAIDNSQTAHMQRPHRDICQTIIDYVVSSTRAGVAAFATGVAFGATRRAMAFAKGNDCNGGRLIDQQWAQSMLAEMTANARGSRQMWIESAMANTLGGLFSRLSDAPIRQLEASVPDPFYRQVSKFILHRDVVTRAFRQQLLDGYPRHWQHRTSGLASLAKFRCTDLALANADMALDISGANGTRHSLGIEKLLRDVKLLQIYEGTNQLNRINLVKCMLDENNDVQVFVREDAA